MTAEPDNPDEDDRNIAALLIDPGPVTTLATIWATVDRERARSAVDRDLLAAADVVLVLSEWRVEGDARLVQVGVDHPLPGVQRQFVQRHALRAARSLSAPSAHSAVSAFAVRPSAIPSPSHRSRSLQEGDGHGL